MIGLLLAWVLYPVVALVVCTGLGLLAERLSGAELPGVLLVPLGWAGLVGVTQLPTYWNWSAELTLPLVIVLAAAGLLLGRERLRRRPDPWPLAAALGVLGVYAAPVILSGEATFAGYTVLGDTSIHFIGSDVLLENGRQFGHIPPSTYEAALAGYYGANGYPSGGITAAAALTSLVHLDIAWTFQPFLSILAALTALGLYALAEPLVRSRPLRAAGAFVAAQPALVYAFAMQGSIKELGTALAVVLIGALIPVWARQAPESARRVVPLAVAASAAIGVVGLASGVWLAPFALAALVAARRAGPRRLAAAAALAALTVAALSYQALLEAASYVEVAGGVVTAQEELGNLLRPLEGRQRFGVWLAGDYRLAPSGSLLTLTEALLVAVWLAMAAGLAWAVRLRAWSVAAFVLISVVAHFYVLRAGSPWADGKALMIVSPALLLLAVAGAGAAAAWRRPAGWAIVAVLALGVLWSNALAYHEVSLAPRDRMAELEEVGERIAGRGPTLTAEAEEFAKHFLRDAAPETATEPWQRRGYLGVYRDGRDPLLPATTRDLDRLGPRFLDQMRTIVLRRGFASSRPGSDFARTWRGTFYEIWERRSRNAVEHLSVGRFRAPGGLPSCDAVRDLAAKAPRLAFVERAPTPTAAPTDDEPLPGTWGPDGDPKVVRTGGQGLARLRLRVGEAGRYAVWLEGSFARGVEVRIGGRTVGAAADHLNFRGSAVQVGTVELAPGDHPVELLRGGGSPAPGNGGTNRLLGPVALTAPDPTGGEVQTIPASRWRSLCTRSVDWIEAVR